MNFKRWKKHCIRKRHTIYNSTNIYLAYHKLGTMLLAWDKIEKSDIMNLLPTWEDTKELQWRECSMTLLVDNLFFIAI